MGGRGAGAEEGEWGYSRPTTQTQSAKIFPNFHFQGGVPQTYLNSKCQDLSKFSFGGDTPDLPKLKVPRSVQIFIFREGGTPDLLKLIVPRAVQIFIFRGAGGRGQSRPTQTQSAKICPNFHWGAGQGRGWGVGVLQTYYPNSKYQDLSKFSFSRGVLQTYSNSKCQDLSKFSFLERGGTPDLLKLIVPRAVQIFIFRGGGGQGQSRPTQTQSTKIFPNFHFQGGCSRPTQTQSAKICKNFHWGEGYSRPSQTQSAKICPNFHFREGGTPDLAKLKVPRSVHILIFKGGVSQTFSYSKCQDLSKFSFWVGGGYSRPTQTQSAKICPNFHFQGWGYSRPTQTQSAKICPNFHFLGWGWGVLQTNIPKYLSAPTQVLLNQIFNHSS